MAKKKASRKKSRPKKRRAAKKKVVIIRRTVVKRIGSTKRKKSSTSSGRISRAKKTIRDVADKLLKDALFERDKATNYKQHRTAQLKVDKARRELRRAN